MINIVFNGIPPSVNGSYATIMMGRKPVRIPSRELKQFKKDFAKSARPAQGEIDSLKDKKLCLMIELWCHQSRLFTKKGTIKKMDVSNRIKSLEDAVSDMLGIDDSNFFRVVIEKRVTELPETTHISIMENR